MHARIAIRASACVSRFGVTRAGMSVAVLALLCACVTPRATGLADTKSVLAVGATVSGSLPAGARALFTIDAFSCAGFLHVEMWDTTRAVVVGSPALVKVSDAPTPRVHRSTKHTIGTPVTPIQDDSFVSDFLLHILLRASCFVRAAPIPCCSWAKAPPYRPRRTPARIGRTPPTR